jgi:hypothetical protein
MTRAEVAEVVFRRAESWFIDNVPVSFPIPFDGLYATEAVREWVRARHDLAADSGDAHGTEKRILERLGSGMGKSSLPGRKAA